VPSGGLTAPPGERRLTRTPPTRLR
jgi:hypothetical protein